MMTAVLIIVAVVGVVSVGDGYAASSPTRPDPKLTAGGVDLRVTQSTLQATICKFGYGVSLAKASSHVKNHVFAEYHVKQSKRGEYTLDRLIPVSLGGSNVSDNFWPEPKGTVTKKNHVENSLHASVCSGGTSLRAAQDAIIHDWTTAAAVTATTTTPTTPTSVPPIVTALPSGTYANGRDGTPHYFVSLTINPDATVTGTMAFLAQDGQTEVVFTFTGTAVANAATLNPSTGAGPISMTYGTRQFQLGNCPQFLGSVRSLAECTFDYVGNGFGTPASSPTDNVSPGVRGYAVTAELNMRTSPGSEAPVVVVIPNGATVGVVCSVTGELVGGPYGATSVWDLVEWNGLKGYASDEYVDTKTDIRTVIPVCNPNTD